MRGIWLAALFLMIIAGCVPEDHSVGACAMRGDVRAWQRVTTPANAVELRSIAIEHETVSHLEFEGLRSERWYALPSGEMMLCRLPTSGNPTNTSGGASWIFATSREGVELISARAWVVN